MITCEGNAGYYEIGAPGTPLDAGYSVLGWNHPGFAGSSVYIYMIVYFFCTSFSRHITIVYILQGQPFPDNERNAIDVVMQYAIHKLGFDPQQIVLYSWSIGGYAAAHAGVLYPDLKYIVCFPSLNSKYY